MWTRLFFKQCKTININFLFPFNFPLFLVFLIGKQHYTQTKLEPILTIANALKTCWKHLLLAISALKHIYSLLYLKTPFLKKAEHLCVHTLIGPYFILFCAVHCIINVCYDSWLIYCKHRRRIYLEDKAKVVMSDWGTESLPR